jgi:hypothetical protein
VTQRMEGSLRRSDSSFECFEHRQHVLPSGSTPVCVADDARGRQFRRTASSRCFEAPARETGTGQRLAHSVEQPTHGRRAHLPAIPRERGRQPCPALAGPSQWRHGSPLVVGDGGAV